MAASNATRSTTTTNPHPLKRDRQKRGKREGDAENNFRRQSKI